MKREKFDIWTLNFCKDHKEDFYLDYVNDTPVIRWKSNDNIPPKECLYAFLHLGYVTEYEVENSLEVHEIELIEKLNVYKERMKNYVHSPEEIYEMKAAFGEGTKVVNVITGNII